MRLGSCRSRSPTAWLRRRIAQPGRRILYRASTNDIRVIEITSPGEREGKTTTTANLAVSLAQTGKTVVAISCDLRRPRLHRFFGLDNSVGLSNLLTGELDPARDPRDGGEGSEGHHERTRADVPGGTVGVGCDG